MRIAFDAKRYFHNRTGLGRYSRELVDGLLRLHPDHDYMLCNPRRADAAAPNGATVLSPKRDNVLYAAYWRSIGVTKELKEHQTEIYHGLSNEIPYGLRSARIRSAVSIHDMIYLRYPHLYKTVDRWIYERKVEYAATHADAVIAISRQTADDISFFYPVRSNRIVVIHQAVTMPATTLQEDRDTLQKFGLPDEYFLYVGTIEERKNLLGVLEALKLSEKKDWRLAVVGRQDAEYYKSCVNFIRQHRLHHNVRFYTGVTRSELSSFYKHSIALIYPSYFEGFGIPIVEAQLCGTPVITTSGGCFGEAAGEAAVFVNPGEPEQIADAMLKMKSEDGLRRLLITRGTENAKRFTPEAFTSSVMAVYKQLV